MHFLIAASDYIEFEKPGAPVVLAIDARINDALRRGGIGPNYKPPSVEPDWLPYLDPLLVINLGKYRAYKTNSLRDLLRVLRNKYNHFRDLPPELQLVMGPIPDGFYKYFHSRFPNLLLCAYEVVKEHFGQEDVFRPYYYHRPSK